MRNDTRLPPRWVVLLLEWFREGLHLLLRSTYPGNMVLYEKFQHLYLLPPLYTAAYLNIAGLVGQGKRPVGQLAREAGVDPDCLYRVMRTLASHGIFSEHPGHCFSNTRLSRPLMEGPGSLRHMLMHHLGPLNWSILGELQESVRTGTDAFSRRYGKSIYDYLSGDPVNSSLFDKSMKELAALGLAPLLQAYDFSRFRILADIGGGEGFLLASILRFNPGLRGILFELPETLEQAHETVRAFQVEDRITLTGGSFLESIPAGADGYLLKHVLHNWDDSSCVQILSHIRHVLPADGALLVVEMVVPPGNRPSVAKMLDIQMLSAMCGGKERTLPEYSELFHRAGLSLSREYPTIAPFSLLEAKANH